MQGLLAQAQQPQQQPQQTQQPSSEMVNIDEARGQTKAMMGKLQRLVVAGQTILYAKETNQKFMEFLDPEAIPQSVGQIASMIVVALIDKAGPEGAPPNLIVPAGALIAADLLDYACKLYDVEMTEEMSKATLVAFAETMQSGVQEGQHMPPQGQMPQGQQQPAQGAM